MKTLQTSVIASAALATGRAFVVQRGAAASARTKGTVEQECALFEGALAKSKEQIEVLAADSDIFAAHLEMIDDPMLSEGVMAHIDEGQSAEEAVAAAAAELVAMFEAIDDEYLAARADDIKDIFARIAANLTGGVTNPFEGVSEGDIVVATELFPSDMALLDLAKIGGLVTALGSATSHLCIIARNHSLAAVVGLGSDVEQIKSGEVVIVDGYCGKVVVNPDQATVDSYTERKEQEQRLRSEQLALAKSEVNYRGSRVVVTANAGSVEEVERAIEAGADGIGLFRSEFIYMHSTAEPTEEEQYQIYSAAAKCCKGAPLTIRTLDIGGDKDVPYLGLPKEENPFLGWRAIRISLEREEMFCRQLRAILRASAEGDVRVMFPMITSVEELLAAKAILERCKEQLTAEGVSYNADMKVGVMIETPAAVLVADSLAAQCDFFSIGTNDLVQYIMAADRANVKVAHLYNPYSEAVKRALKWVIAAADSANIECSVCGELASDNEATEMLIAANLRKFSVNIGAIASVKYKISKL